MEHQQKTIEKLGELDEIYRRYQGRIIGPREHERAWGVELHSNPIPSIPYSQLLLDRLLLKEDGILRFGIHTMGDGTKLSIKEMEERYRASIVIRHGKDTLRSSLAAWRNEELFTKELPQEGWRIVRATPLPETRGKNYFEQTKILRTYGRQLRILADRDCEESSDEILAELAGLIQSSQHDSIQYIEAVRRLVQLPVNKKMRRSAVDTYFDIATSHLAHQVPLLTMGLDWTSSMTKRGGIISVGDSGKSLLLTQTLIDPVFPTSSYSILGSAPYLAT